MSHYFKPHSPAAQQLRRYKTVLRDLNQAWVNIPSLTSRDLPASRQYRETNALLTNHSLIVAAMRRERITFLATNDADFARIPNLAIRLPE